MSTYVQRKSQEDMMTLVQNKNIPSLMDTYAKTRVNLSSYTFINLKKLKYQSHVSYHSQIFTNFFSNVTIYPLIQTTQFIPSNIFKFIFSNSPKFIYSSKQSIKLLKTSFYIIFFVFKDRHCFGII